MTRSLELAASAAAPRDDEATPDLRFPLVRVADLIDHIESPEYIVDGLLERGVTVRLIGAPESGKSLLALHLGARVATGRPFFGRTMARGLVGLAGEGDNGIARCLQSIERHHRFDLKVTIRGHVARRIVHVVRRRRRMWAPISRRWMRCGMTQIARLRCTTASMASARNGRSVRLPVDLGAQDTHGGGRGHRSSNTWSAWVCVQPKILVLGVEEADHRIAVPNTATGGRQKSDTIEVRRFQRRRSPAVPAQGRLTGQPIADPIALRTRRPFCCFFLRPYSWARLPAPMLPRSKSPSPPTVSASKDGENRAAQWSSHVGSVGQATVCKRQDRRTNEPVVQRR